MKVLIVEDDKIYQGFLKRVFTDSGHEVVGIAATRTDALRLFREAKPDLVTMDGSISNSEPGLPIARALRAEDAGVVIIMITGQEDLKFEGRGICKRDLDYGNFDARIVQECLPG